MKTSNRSVRRTFGIRSSPSRVFRALTVPGQLTRWLCESAEISCRTGGPYRFVFPGGWEHTGTLARYVPGRSITFRWSWNGVPLKGTLFRLTVKPADGGSLLTVVHSGFPRKEKWVDLYGITEWGWTYYVMNLKSVLETGHDLRSGLDG